MNIKRLLGLLAVVAFAAGPVASTAMPLSDLDPGDGVYVRNMIGSELVHVVRIDLDGGRVKIMRDDGYTEWVSGDDVLSREGATWHVVGQLAGAALIVQCSQDPACDSTALGQQIYQGTYRVGDPFPQKGGAGSTAGYDMGVPDDAPYAFPVAAAPIDSPTPAPVAVPAPAPDATSPAPASTVSHPVDATPPADALYLPHELTIWANPQLITVESARWVRFGSIDRVVYDNARHRALVQFRDDWSHDLGVGIAADFWGSWAAAREIEFVRLENGAAVERRRVPLVQMPAPGQ
jgi:hypothetical protein